MKKNIFKRVISILTVSIVAASFALFGTACNGDSVSPEDSSSVITDTDGEQSSSEVEDSTGDSSSENSSTEDSSTEDSTSDGNKDVTGPWI